MYYGLGYSDNRLEIEGLIYTIGQQLFYRQTCYVLEDWYLSRKSVMTNSKSTRVLFNAKP